MKSMMRRTTLREIKNTFGRFAAILAIIALGVGLFAGLRMTKPDMVRTIMDFYNDTDFYDLHLLSTLGYTDDDVDEFAKQDDVKCAEGGYSFDVMYLGLGENETALKTISIPEQVNRIQLTDGRMPEAEDECVIDAKMTDVQIGDVIKVSDNNNDDTMDALKIKEFTVTGKVNSPLYINFERGTTTLGTGKLTGYVYIMPEAFGSECYTDVYVAFDQSFDLYSDEYEDFIDGRKDLWEDVCKDRVRARYKDVLMSMGMTEDMAEAASSEENEDVKYYILGRDTNVGYVCFESDSGIVSGVAKVFPVFFILVAVLVCMTTMNRMVEDQRSMIGMLKALGYGETAIMGKYMIYSGTAAVAGCGAGYMAGTYVFPEVIWFAYHLMYIDIPLERVLNLPLIAVVFVVSLLCTIGTTWVSCRVELSETAAELMRPKAPKPGKRVFLEEINCIWSRLKFLSKVSVRNIFRYKKRLFMMIIGISGCTALLLTGFGLNDSIAGFAEDQFECIQVGDGTVVLKDTVENSGDNDIVDTLDSLMDTYDFACETSLDLVEDKGVKPVNMVIMENPDNISRYMKFADEKGRDISYPGYGEAVINNALADLYDITVGDEILLRDSDMNELTLRVSGIFVNHVYNYVYISPDTYEDQMGSKPACKSVYFNLKDGSDAHRVSARLMDNSLVTSVTINKDVKDRVSNMMKSLNYIVLVIILSAGALAFIVLYNLTNINITERIREIATIKVLGFFKNETSAYVFRENRVLTALGIAVGLVLGVFLHRFVMAQIKVDMVYFDVYIAPLSYVFSILLTFLFNFLVNLLMSARLEKINMAESLKSVE